MAQEREDGNRFHALSAATVLASVDAAATGLNSEEAARRLAANGPNRLPAAPSRGPVARFLQQFNNILIYVLLASAATTAALDHWTDTGVIFAVVVANAVIGFIQEGRAERAMAALHGMLATRATVLRDGRRLSIGAADLVVGDIVLVEAGDKAPADLRLIEAKGVRVEEAILTGESAPVTKRVEPVANDAALGDRASMLFSGTLVVAGAARGVVVATAGRTEIGRIGSMVARVEALTTPLVQQMGSFARWLTLFILVIAASLIVYGSVVRHLPFVDLFMIVVGLSVAAIPEGLPAVLTITLAVGVQAMARRNAIVRQLPAIETLGSVSVICSDKTGTLTRNEMKAVAVATAEGVYSIGGEGYSPFGLAYAPDGEPVTTAAGALMEIARIAALCNDAALHGAVDRAWRVEGDPMEGALLALAGKITGEGAAPFSTWRRDDVITFDAAHRYMAVLAHDHDGHAGIFVKGAPEAVLDLSANERTSGGGVVPLESGRWNRMVEKLAHDGQRVLALAWRPMRQGLGALNTEDLLGQLTLIGLVGLIDPPRSEAIAAVAECRSAGIQVKMITGDHAATAQAIARQLGISHTDQVVTGSNIDAMNDAELASAAATIDIFARTSPAHKLRLVTALQSLGLTVAMTGDGVNDAPALKRADAGIAMGRKGSEAAKETAVLVLADDNFASIVAAVREGRTVYDNIKKVISWTLPTNAGEAMTLVVALFSGMALPVTAVQILWVNLITAITLGIALAFEPTERGTMQRPPRPRDQPLLSGELIWHIALVSFLFIAAVFGVYTYAIDKGHPQALAQTMAVNMLVVLEIFHLFYVRNIHGTSFTWAAARGTRVVWACVIGVTLAQFAVTYVPPLQSILGTQSVPFWDGLLIVAVGALFFALIEIEKQIRLAIQRTRPKPRAT